MKKSEPAGIFRILFDTGNYYSLSREETITYAFYEAIQKLPESMRYHAHSILAIMVFLPEQHDSGFEKALAEYLGLDYRYLLSILQGLREKIEKKYPELFEPLIEIRSARMGNACEKSAQQLYKHEQEDAMRIIECLNNREFFIDSVESTCEEKIAKSLSMPLGQVCQILLRMRIDTEALGPYYKKENTTWDRQLRDARAKKKNINETEMTGVLTSS